MRLLPILALCALPLPALAQEEDDEGFLTGFIEEQLSATARAVDIQGFAGALSSRATIERLTIADEEGVWLLAEDLALDWNRSALLRGRIEIAELTAASIEIRRPPIPDPEAPSPEATPFALPDLPVSVEIGDLRADRILLGEPVLGEELALTLGGEVDLAGGEGTARIEAEILEGSEGSLDFQGSYSNATRILSVDLDLREEEGGLVARALDLPDLPSVALDIEGTAPIDDYEATLTLATAGEERVEGTFALQTTGDPGERGVVERAFGLDVAGDLTPLLPPDATEFIGPDARLRTKGIRRSDGSLVLTSLRIGTQALDLSGQAEITPEGWPARIDLTGTIGAADGAPVPLPGLADTTVGEVTLEVAYDRAEGEAWTGTFAIDDLARPGLAIDALTLEGGGAIQPATETEAGRFTADLGYVAEGLAFTDAGLGAALGADLSGDIDLVRTEDGGPLRIRRLTLSGPGLEAQAEGTVGAPDTGFLTQSSILLEAQDLARFAALTGLDLGGSADVTVVSALRPLDGIFDLVLSGSTEDLELGIESLDPLLAGSGEVTLSAARDEAGLRVDTLSIATDAVTATGEADLTSGASQAEFDLAIADLGLSFPDLSGPGTVRGRFARDETGAGTLDAEATLPGAAVTLDAEIGPDLGTPDGREAPGLVTFEARADLEELSGYRDLLAAFAPDLPVAPAGGADLRLSGTTELDADLFDVTLDARTRDLAIGQEAFDAAFAGEGRLAGRVIRTGFDALRVEDLRVDTPLLDGLLTADLGEGTGRAELDLRLADVGPVLGGLSGPGRVAGTAARAADGTTALDLDLTLPTGDARVEGTLGTAPEGFPFAGDILADFEDIAPLGRLLGRDLQGAVRADLSGRIRPDLTELDLAFDATTRDLALGIPRLDPFLAGDGTLSGRAARDGADLRLEDLRIATDLLDGTVTAALEDGAASADLDLALADVAPVLGGVSGPGRLAGTARQTGEGTTALDLDLTLPTGTASVEGTLGTPLEGFPFAGDILADFEDIAPLGALAGRDLSGALRADLSGTLRPDLSALDLAFDATSRDLALGIPRLDPFLAGEGAFSGRAARDGDDLRLEDVRIATDLLDGTVTAEIEGGVGSADLDLSIADVEPVLGGLSGPGRLAGTARQTGEGTTALDLRATLPTGEAAIEGILAGPVEGYAFTGDILADFEDIAPLGALAGRDLSGAVEATATGTIRPDLALLDLAFEAATRDLALGVPSLDALLAGEGSFAGRAERTGPTSFRLEDVALETDLLSGTVSAGFEDGEGEAELDLALADVAPVLGGLSGPGRLSGTASGLGEGSVELDLLATLPTGTASLDGTLDLDQGNAFTGDLAADFDDISPLGALVGRDLGGALSGAASGTVRPDLSAFDLDFDLATQDLRLGEPLLDPLLAGPGAFAGRADRTAAGDLVLDLDADTPQLRGDLDATLGAGTGEGRFDLALADLGLIAPGFSGPATASGQASRAADGSITVDALATGPGLRADIDATVAPPDQGSEIAGTADLSLADLSLLSPFVGRPLSGGFDGTVSGTALPSFDRFDLALDGTARGLALGSDQLDLLLAGAGAVSARVSKAEGGPVTIQSLSADFPNLDLAASGDAGAVAFDATLADLGLFVPVLPGVVTASGTAALGGPGGPLVDAQVTGPGGLSARVQGPVGSVTDLAIAGTGDLALFNRLIDPRRLDGPATFDLRLAEPSLDALTGTVATSGARLSDPTLGEAIRNISGTATLGGGAARLDLAGDLALGGRLAVTGPIGLAPPFVADLAILGTGLVVRDPALYEAVGDARLTVAGPLAGGALIAGVVDLARVEGRVPASEVTALGDVPDVFHIEPSLPVALTLRRAGLSPAGEEISPETGASRGGGAPYGLDILLRAPNQVFVRGRGLDAELGGELRLSGTTAAVLPIGQFALIRGRLDLLGQRFDLTEGSGTLQGDFNPTIRVVAETEARTGTEIRVVVEGPLASPTVSFESTPELPQDEVLAQLLFGVDIEQITPLQAVRLASAVATLAGEGAGLLDELRGGFGLADFDVTTTDDGAIALRLGRYIAENVYTDVVVSPEETEATINLDLTPDLTVRAGVTTEGETTLGIFFERDY